jgi:hypothetical protein
MSSVAKEVVEGFGAADLDDGAVGRRSSSAERVCRCSCSPWRGVGAGVVDDEQVAHGDFGQLALMANLSQFSHSEPTTS